MKKISLQWRITIITTFFIAVICGSLTLFVYKNGVYYIDLLQNTVTPRAAGMTRRRMVMKPMKYILIFRMTSGMNLPVIFPSRYTIIKKIIEKGA